ncbi:MAG: universal stress protein [Sneathiella sp.]|nr:universal stress protein [Sneathiella sp.]
MPFKSNTKSTLELDKELRAFRKTRFRLLICIDGSDESYEGLKLASKLGRNHDVDIVLLYVRPIDQGLRSGGLQLRVVRENMLEWGLELPGIKYLKKGLDILIGEKGMAADWTEKSTHTDVWGDPMGDNKIEYRHDTGRSIVMKLKTAPDPASGILDQYELGPYNLIVMGEPSRWRGELMSFWNAGVVQKVAMLSLCSVMVARKRENVEGHLICTDGSENSLDSVRRQAVLAQYLESPITLLCVTPLKEDLDKIKYTVEKTRLSLEKSGISIKETRAIVGDPVEKITEIGADFAVIAVSDSGKSSMKRFILGSVAFNVMGKAKTSVLNAR